MTKDLSLGIDIGTTGTKGVLVSGSGALQHVCRVVTPWHLSPTGREMAASDLFETIDAILKNIQDVLVPGERIGSIGITSMGQTGAFFAPSGEALCPLVSWDDSRNAAGATVLAGSFGAARFSAITGLPLDPSWTICRLINEFGGRSPQTGAIWLGVADAVAFHLTGKAASELSLACQSGLVDLSARDWSADLLDWAGIDRASMPALRTAGDAVGKTLRGDIAGVPVFIAGHDHIVAAIGAGAADRVTLYDSCGTAETILRMLSPADALPRTAEIVECGLQLGWHCLADHMVLAASHRATWGLERMRGLLNLPVEALAAAQDTGSLRIEGVLDYRFTISGHAGTPLELWAAAQTAVATETAALEARMRSFVAAPQRTIVSGGWSLHHPFVAARSARFPGTRTATTSEAAGLGAALLAATGATASQTIARPL